MDETLPGGTAPPQTNAPEAKPRGPSTPPPSVRTQQEVRSQKLLLLVVRLLFLVLLVTVTLLTIASTANRPEEFEFTTVLGLFIGSAAVGIIVLLLDAMTPNKRLSSVVGVYLGVCVGLIGALAIGALIDVVAEAWDLNQGMGRLYLGLGKFVIAIVLCYLAVSVVLTTKDDFRLVIPYVEFSKQIRGIRPMAVDTSVLIDGRIETVSQTGFMDASLVVPQFVIDELQALADSGDKLKRARGRRGLTVLGKLQENPYLDISIDDTDPAGRSVDRKLIQLAADQNMRVLTTDYNLNKVAQIHGVDVLNFNDLANGLKSSAIPGERLEVEVVKRGEAQNQGVGYMPDGTMVVVENGAERVGRLVTISVTNTLQTSAGRMIFGRLLEEDDVDDRPSVEQMSRAATGQPRHIDRPEPAPVPRAAAARRNPRRSR